MDSPAHEAVMVHCGYEANLCKLYRYSHNLPTFYPYSCVKFTAARGQMWIVMFSFSCIGNQVWYVLTGANLHVTCLLWVWLSLLCVTTTQALDVQVSMPRRNTMLLCVKRFVTVARHYTLFLCQSGVLNQAILAHLVGMFAYLERSRIEFYGARFMEMASRDIFELFGKQKVQICWFMEPPLMSDSVEK